MKSLVVAVLALTLSLAAIQPVEAGPLRAGVRGVARVVSAPFRFVRARRPLARLFGFCR